MFDSEISSASYSYDVPESWIRAVIQVESNWNPNAFNPNDPGGSRGLMQISGPTAKAYGVTDLDSLFDPLYNIGIGTRLLGDLRQRYGDDFQAVYSAYNSGSPTLWQTSSQVAGHVENALNALAQFAEDNPAVVQTAAVGGSVLFWVLLFVIGKKILGK
jgi:soluble lytic murein transglycosylase-like protein